MQTVKLQVDSIKEAIWLSRRLVAIGAEAAFRATGHWQVFSKSRELIDAENCRIVGFTKGGAAWLQDGSHSTLCLMTACSRIIVTACWPDLPAGNHKRKP